MAQPLDLFRDKSFLTNFLAALLADGMDGVFNIESTMISATLRGVNEFRSSGFGLRASGEFVRPPALRRRLFLGHGGLAGGTPGAVPTMRGDAVPTG